MVKGRYIDLRQQTAIGPVMRDSIVDGARSVDEFMPESF